MCLVYLKNWLPCHESNIRILETYAVRCRVWFGITGLLLASCDTKRWILPSAMCFNTTCHRFQALCCPLSDRRKLVKSKLFVQGQTIFIFIIISVKQHTVKILIKVRAFILIIIHLEKRGGWLLEAIMSLVMRKPVFGVCDQVRLKLACAATETS